MPPPDCRCILDESDGLLDQAMRLVNIASEADTLAGYWQGRCEGLEHLIGVLESRVVHLERRLAAADQSMPGSMATNPGVNPNG